MKKIRVDTKCKYLKNEQVFEKIYQYQFEYLTWIVNIPIEAKHSISNLKIIYVQYKDIEFKIW